MRTNFYSPNTRESAHEIKERMWRYEQKGIVDLKNDVMPWELKEAFYQFFCKKYGTPHIPRVG